MKSILLLSNKALNTWPSGSSPISPTSETLQPNEERFKATFAAPPKLCSTLLTSIIGTGLPEIFY